MLGCERCAVMGGGGVKRGQVRWCRTVQWSFGCWSLGSAGGTCRCITPCSHVGVVALVRERVCEREVGVEGGVDANRANTEG
jgi:hypothetical protein